MKATMKRYMSAWLVRQDDSQGFVSIFSVMIIMGILTLLTIGFTNIARQAQRSSLDNQLSTQAFYAAESGVNDGIAAIQAAMATNAVYTKDTCDGDTANFTYVISAAQDVHYTCVLVDSTPPNLTIDDVPVAGVSEPYLTTLASANGAVIDEIVFSWDSRNTGDPIIPDGFPAPGANPLLYNATTWAARVGIMRIDLIPSNIIYNRASLVNDSYTFYLYPSQNGVQTPFTAINGTANHGAVFEADCIPPATPPRCSARVQLGGLTANRYSIRLQSYYNPVRVTVEAMSGGSVVNTRDGQALIDSTGRANDVFRRIQVRVPLNPVPGLHETFSILSGDSICKRLVTAGGATPSTQADPLSPTDPACQIP